MCNFCGTFAGYFVRGAYIRTETRAVNLGRQ